MILTRNLEKHGSYKGRSIDLSIELSKLFFYLQLAHTERSLHREIKPSYLGAQPEIASMTSVRQDRLEKAVWGAASVY